MLHAECIAQDSTLCGKGLSLDPDVMDSHPNLL